jgi:hypothetical protein
MAASPRASSIRSRSDARRQLIFRRALAARPLPCRDATDPRRGPTVLFALVGRQVLCHAAAMPSLRVATWNIAGARREQTNQVDLDAVVAGVRALGVDLLSVQEVDRHLARSGRTDQPTVIAQALGAGWFWSFAPALVGDDFRPLSGPDPGGPAYGNLLVSRLPLAGSSICGSRQPAAVSSAPRSWPASRLGRARSPTCPTGRATTSASCDSSRRSSQHARRRGCWWAT